MGFLFKGWISVKSLSAYRCLFMILLPAKLWPALLKYSLGFQLWELTGKNKSSILNSLCWNFMPTMNCALRSAPKVIRKRILIWGAKLLLEKKQCPDPKSFIPQSLSNSMASLPCDNIWTGNFKAAWQLWNCSLRVKDDCLKGQEVFSSTTKQNNRFRLEINGLSANLPQNPKTN